MRKKDLFSDSLFAFGKPKHVEANPIPEKIKLQFEKEVLGFYLSEHPIAKIRQQGPQVNATIQTMRTMPANSFVKCIGAITEVRQLRTKKGELMAFVQLEDEFGTIVINTIPERIQSIASGLKEDAFVYVEGNLEYRFNKLQLKVKINTYSNLIFYFVRKTMRFPGFSLHSSIDFVCLNYKLV